MMFYQKFDNDITASSVQELIDRTCDRPFVTIHFSTNGGEYSSILMLIDYINSRKGSIFVVFDYVALSAGFLLLTKLKCEYTFNESFEKALIHKLDAMALTQRSNKFSKKRKKLLVKMNKKLLDTLIKLGISKKEQKRFEKGRDLVFYKEDLKRMGLWKIQKNPILKEIKKAIKLYQQEINYEL
jgi:ATP-dependent protease ClpP protease subunit